jgi:ferredoxin
MIKVYVDMEKCQHYGQCVFEAPEIFKLNSDDRLAYLATAEDSENGHETAAADVCPMQAISIVN